MGIERNGILFLTLIEASARTHPKLHRFFFGMASLGCLSVAESGGRQPNYLSNSHGIRCSRGASALNSFSIKKVEQVFFIIGNVKLLQQIYVFFPECFFVMVFWLIENIIYNGLDLRFGIGKRTIPVLPGKFSG